MLPGSRLKLFKMVKIISCKLSQNTDGKDFVSLKLQGGIEAIQSQQSGRFYLTAKTCYIPSTFDQATAEALIGSEMPGKVSRVESESIRVHCEGHRRGNNTHPQVRVSSGRSNG